MQLVVDKIAKAFGIHEIFKNVSFMIAPKTRRTNAVTEHAAMSGRKERI